MTSPRRNVVAQVSEARRSAKYSFAPTISFAGLLRSRIVLTAVPQHLPPKFLRLLKRSPRLHFGPRGGVPQAEVSAVKAPLGRVAIN